MYPVILMECVSTLSIWSKKMFPMIRGTNTDHIFHNTVACVHRGVGTAPPREVPILYHVLGGELPVEPAHDLLCQQLRR